MESNMEDRKLLIYLSVVMTVNVILSILNLAR